MRGPSVQTESEPLGHAQQLQQYYQFDNDNFFTNMAQCAIPDEIHTERKRNARGNKRRFLVLLTIMAQMDLSS